MPIIPAVGTNAQIDLVYAVASNTFVQRVAPDPINGNLVEIGDSKQPDFYPQLKLMRWRNEVNFSARLVELDASPAIVETAGKVIKYKKASYEAHYYDLGFDDDAGGFEHEIVLKARPAQSVIRWTIQTKGLDFLYQAELTPEEISGGVQRPQDIIGSYAVYHSTASNDFNGGKNYRSGKAFHIKRPKAHDALGNEVWCELNIDPAAGIMTVTIPQGFLDTAVYPVVVDPTFGYETAGASAVPEPYLFANIFAASRYTASTGDVITKITASGVSVSGTDGFGFGVYTFNGTNPVALTGTEQHIVFPTSQAWVDSSALSIGLTKDVQYCLAFGNQDAGTQYVYYDTGVSGDGDVDPTGTALPATFTHDSYTAYKFSIYATYTADAPAALSGDAVVTFSAVGASNAASTLAGDEVTTSSIVGSSFAASSAAGDEVTTSSIVGESFSQATAAGDEVTTASIVGSSFSQATAAGDEVTTASIVGSSFSQATAAGDVVVTFSAVGASSGNSASGDAVVTFNAVGSALFNAALTGDAVVSSSIVGSSTGGAGAGGGYSKYKKQRKIKPKREVNWLFRDIRDFYVELIEIELPDKPRATLERLIAPYSFGGKLPIPEKINWQGLEKNQESVAKLLDLWIKYVPDPEVEKEKKESLKIIDETEKEIDFVSEAKEDFGLTLLKAQLRQKIVIEKAYLESIRIIEKAREKSGALYREYKARKAEITQREMKTSALVKDIAYIVSYLEDEFD